MLSRTEDEICGHVPCTAYTVAMVVGMTDAMIFRSFCASVVSVRDGIVDWSTGTNLKIGRFQKLSCLPGAEGAEMLVAIFDRLGGFVQDIEDMTRYQNQGRQCDRKAVNDFVYGRRG